MRDQGKGNWFRSMSEQISSRTEFFAGTILCLIVLITSYEAVMRYFLRSPTLWVYEIAHYLLAVVVTWGIAHGLITGIHITVDVVYQRLPLQWRFWLDVVTSSLAVCVAALYLWTAILLIIRTRLRGDVSLTTLQIPLYLPQIGPLIGFLLFFLVAVMVCANNWQRVFCDHYSITETAKPESQILG